jgi:hypothetical protein
MVSVARCLPDKRVHKDTAIEADDVVAHLDDLFPPGLFDVIFQFNAQWAVIVTACQAAIDFARLKYEPAPFAQ